MYNWAVDTRKLKKNPRKFAVWKLEQMINFGLGRGRISRTLLKKYWNQLDISADKKRYLSFLLWGRKY